MSALQRCTRETVTLQTFDGARPTPAWRDGYFAVHERPNAVGGLIANEWSITHLPSGIRFYATFTNAEDAAEAMVEIARLRNDWGAFDPFTVTEQFKADLKGIYARHKGFLREPNKAACEAFFRQNYRTDLNGFKAAG